MVWMHGGGFTNGSAIESYAYDGRTLSEFGDVVAVSINHRLNILGTLDLLAYGPEYANSRHTGMADIVVTFANRFAHAGNGEDITLYRFPNPPSRSTPPIRPRIPPARQEV
jgi:para-nitrobenzyl esterase